MIEAGQEHPWALGAVVTALAGYDQSQTGLYVDEIRELLKDGVGVMPTDAVTEAFDKLDRFVNSVP